MDIAVNKLFTIYQNPRGRDYYDFYFIFKERKDFSLENLLKLLRSKFDVVIDYIQLGANLLKSATFLDDPIVKKKIDKNLINNFFIKKAQELKK